MQKLLLPPTLSWLAAVLLTSSPAYLVAQTLPTNTHIKDQASTQMLAVNLSSNKLPDTVAVGRLGLQETLRLANNTTRISLLPNER